VDISVPLRQAYGSYCQAYSKTAELIQQPIVHPQIRTLGRKP